MEEGMSRKFCVLAATAWALVLLWMPVASSAHARKLPGELATAARRIADPGASVAPRVGPHVHVVGLKRLARGRPRIIGGFGAVQSDWPFMAFIAYFDANGDLEFNCTGTVVAPNLVLTAGHCAVDETTGAPLDPAGFGVVTSSVDWTNNAQRQVSPVSEVIVEPGYDPISDESDAALLVLSSPTTAATISLATPAETYLEAGGTAAFIAGWGETFSGDPDLQTYLQWAPTVVQPAGYCSQFNLYFDGTSELCAVDPPDFLTGTCNGDSGGPLAAYGPNAQLVEIGITTLGPEDCNTATADYFTATIPLYSWVAHWIQAVAPPPPTPAPSSAPSAPASSPPPSTSTQPSTPFLPTMTLSQAKHDVRQTVTGALGQRAKPAHSYAAKCSRKSSTRFTCSVEFWHGPNDYYGNVTVYLLRAANGLLEWSDNYALHWVNDECYFRSDHPQTCTIHNRRGSW
jgi:secreted trypsin-like serine protease